jgi:membrane protein
MAGDIEKGGSTGHRRSSRRSATRQLRAPSAKGSATLGISFVVSLVISLWSASGGIKAFFGALNVVYEEKEKGG